jgi:hypothetical protein
MKVVCSLTQDYVQTVEVSNDRLRPVDLKQMDGNLSGYKRSRLLVHFVIGHWIDQDPVARCHSRVVSMLNNTNLLAELATLGQAVFEKDLMAVELCKDRCRQLQRWLQRRGQAQHRTPCQRSGRGSGQAASRKHRGADSRAKYKTIVTTLEQSAKAQEALRVPNAKHNSETARDDP